MKAIQFSTFGSASEALQLVEIEMPQPGPGEVLVRVHASGINPSIPRNVPALSPICLMAVR